MTRELRHVTKVVNRVTHIHVTSLTLNKGTMNVLLGPTLSGKTSLMRLMAGLGQPNWSEFLAGQGCHRHARAGSIAGSIAWSASTSGPACI